MDDVQIRILSSKELIQFANVQSRDKKKRKENRKENYERGLGGGLRTMEVDKIKMSVVAKEESKESKDSGNRRIEIRSK